MRRLALELFRYGVSLQGWLLVLLGTLVCGILIPPTLLLAPLWPRVRVRFADATHVVLAVFRRVVWCMRICVDGEERRLPGTRVLVSNHQSWLDPLVLMGIEPRLHGPIRRYLLEVPVFGAIPRMCGFFPSEIGELTSLETMQEAVAAARAREGSLLFFPEGTRGEGGVVGDFHRGAFRAAFDHQLAIQPVVIEGLDRVLPRTGAVVQTAGRQRVRVRYLAPIEPPFEEAPSGLRRDTVRALSERVREMIVAELDGMRAEPGDGNRLESATASR